MVHPSSVLTTAVILASSLGLLPGAQAQTPPAAPAVDPAFFPNLVAKETFTWVPCYSGLQCAKWRVPANVNQKGGKDKVELAIVKLPALSGKKKGTLIFSSGAYSVSNTNFMVTSGASLAVVYPDYDMVGIDRRGTGWSTPSLRCFESNEQRRAWAAAEPDVLGSSDEALAQHYSRAKEFGALCKKNGEEAAKWMGTYPSAVDIYNFMTAIGEKKISFHGISSGTHTAQTFAMLYPEAVDKFVLDAPVRSPIAYTVIDSLPDSSMDAELVLDGFFEICLAVPTFCPFAGTSTKPNQLRKRYEDLDQQLKKGPIAGLSYSNLHVYLTFAVLDGANFPVLAQLLSELESKKAGQGVATVLQIVNAPVADLPLLDDSYPFDHLQAAVCADVNIKELGGLDTFKQYLQQMLKASPAIGGAVAKNRLYCMGWQVEPINRVPRDLFEKRTGNTIAGQILYITTTADPFCPLDSAYYMSEKYFPKKSIVVVDHALGHTSVLGSTLSGTGGPNGTNWGIFEVIGTWLQGGPLAPADSVYRPDFPPFITVGAEQKGQLRSGFGSIKAPPFPVSKPAWVP